MIPPQGMPERCFIVVRIMAPRCTHEQALDYLEHNDQVEGLTMLTDPTLLEAELSALREARLVQGEEVYRARSALLHRCLGFAPDCKALDAGQLAERTVALVDELRALVREQEEQLTRLRNAVNVLYAVFNAAATLSDSWPGTSPNWAALRDAVEAYRELVAPLGEKARAAVGDTTGQSGGGE